MARIPGRFRVLLALSGLVVGLALVCYGYAFRATGLVPTPRGAPGSSRAEAPAPSQAPLWVSEWDLVKGAAGGTIRRLPDGKLSLAVAAAPGSPAPT